MMMAVRIIFCAVLIILLLTLPFKSWGANESDPQIDAAWQKLVAQLKAAEDAGLIVTHDRAAIDLSSFEDVPRSARPAASTAPAGGRNDGLRSGPRQYSKCINASTFAAARDALGNDPLNEIERIRRSAEDPGAPSVRNRMALAYLSLGFVDEAAALLRGRSSGDAEGAALAAVASGAGAVASATTAIGVCSPLASLIEYAISPEQKSGLNLGQAEKDELSALPRPLGTSIAARIASRLLNDGRAEDSAWVRSLLADHEETEGPATIEALARRMTGLRRLERVDAHSFVLSTDELQVLSRLVDHPEYVARLDVSAAATALNAFIALGAAQAIEKTKIADAAKAARPDLILSRAYLRGGALAEAGAVLAGRGDEGDLALVGAIEAAEPALTADSGRALGLVGAWRVGDWERAEPLLAALSPESLDLKSARRLAVAAALNGKTEPPAPATEAFQKSGDEARLASVFVTPPHIADWRKARKYSDAIAQEIQLMREMLEDE